MHIKTVGEMREIMAMDNLLVRVVLKVYIGFVRALI